MISVPYPAHSAHALAHALAHAHTRTRTHAHASAHDRSWSWTPARAQPSSGQKHAAAPRVQKSSLFSFLFLGTEYRTENTGSLPEVPLVLLVDKNTASAAEVFAASLQENGRSQVTTPRPEE